MSDQNLTDVTVNTADILASGDMEAVEAEAVEVVTTEIGSDDNFLEAFSSLPVEKLSRKNGADRGIASLSVINSLKGNGNRVTITDTLFDELGQPKSLQFSMNNSTLAIASELPGVTEIFTFKSADVHILYNKALALAIAKAFGLDYSGGTTSYSFRDIKYKDITNNEGETIPVALVSMTAI